MGHPISNPDVPSTQTETVSDCARRLIVMTHIPEAGRVKTRLIPVMGLL